MSLAVVHTRAQVGIEAPCVAVETHLSNGLPAFNIVGLAQTAVKESKDRVRSALLNSHFEFPARRITVNLAPADIPKIGGRYDLAIAIGILVASNQLSADAIKHCEFYGELALGGALRSVSGLVPALLKGAQKQQTLFVPTANASQASLLQNAECLSASHLLEVCAHLNGNQALTAVSPSPISRRHNDLDLNEVKGQQAAKRALEIAAAGRHNILLCGPPGSGKTMLASRLPSILPSLNEEQILEVAAIHSLLGGSPVETSPTEPLAIDCNPPFRAPHHTASAIALIGGGSKPGPGEISLAHNGVLFLDEFPEFQRAVIEALREPLESGEIRIARANAQITLPSKFLLIAARNPCPCGYYGVRRTVENGVRRTVESGVRRTVENGVRRQVESETKSGVSGKLVNRKPCRCTPNQIANYNKKLSGPLLDRIDLHINVQGVPPSELDSRDPLDPQSNQEESSSDVLSRVNQARQRQASRTGACNGQLICNGQLSVRQVQQYCVLSDTTKQLLHQASDQLDLSARAYHKILKVARTIADLNGNESINKSDLLEALAYRPANMGEP